jgi:hypothetical protein
MPSARVVTQAYGSAEALWLMSKGNEPRIGRDQGSGLMVRPYPARTTVFSEMRYMAPTRGAKYSFWRSMPTSLGTLP